MESPLGSYGFSAVWVREFGLGWFWKQLVGCSRRLHPYEFSPPISLRVPRV